MDLDNFAVITYRNVCERFVQITRSNTNSKIPVGHFWNNSEVRAVSDLKLVTSQVTLWSHTVALLLEMHFLAPTTSY